MKQIMLLLILVMAAAACKKSVILVYETKGDIYFDNHTVAERAYWINYYDSVRYSFGNDLSINEDSISVAVSISGDTAGIDRPFSVVVDQSASNAVEGVDYVLPENKEFFIPRGGVQATFYVKVMKSDALIETPAILVLKLKPNEYFDTLIRYRDASYYNDLKIKAPSYKIIVDYIVPRPAYWDDFTNYFGDYSQEKYLLVLKVNNLDIKTDLTGLNDTYYKEIATQTQLYLNQQAAAGNIIRERNGIPMVMGADVQ